MNKREAIQILAELKQRTDSKAKDINGNIKEYEKESEALTIAIVELQEVRK